MGETILGLDIGTSAVKAALVDLRGKVLASATKQLATSRPKPGWSEQNPADWIAATWAVLADIKSAAASDFACVRAIGLSGQMHGAMLLDAENKPLRPAILWNDARSETECAEMLAALPNLPQIAGVLPMPGFTAPKLRWLQKHETDVFRKVRTVLCAKDYVRLHLTGELCTDMSDAAGTLWLDEAGRRWSEDILSASGGLSLKQMPRLIEGTETSGHVRKDICAEFGWTPGVVVPGGGGDASMAAVGLGSIANGDAFISLGTSGQLFVTTDNYRPRPETLVHAFAFCLPGRWLQMAAMLNGASCLAWVASALGRSGDIDALLRETEQTATGPSDLLFLPYLAGERTPHNDASARGVFFGLGAATTAQDMTRAVLEGVAYSFREARSVLAAAGTDLSAVDVLGGGARSSFWLQIMSDVTGLRLSRLDGTDLGPAYGASRLARAALTGEAIASICTKPKVLDHFGPDPSKAPAYAAGFERYRALYKALKPEFRRLVASGG